MSDIWFLSDDALHIVIGLARGHVKAADAIAQLSALDWSLENATDLVALVVGVEISA